MAQERAALPNGPIAENTAPAELVNEVLAGSYQRRVPGTGDMRHGTEGWHALETSCKVMPALFAEWHALEMSCMHLLKDGMRSNLLQGYACNF